MTTTAFAGNVQLTDFYNLFISSKKTSVKPEGQLPKSAVEDTLRTWFNKSSYLTPVEFSTIAGGKILPTDRIIVKFKLASPYLDQFVLLRGLLEFSRPKGLVVAANNSEKAFEFQTDKNQVGVITTYLDKILDRMTKELSFKKTLKAVLRFEKSVRLEQSRLYEQLHGSGH